MFALRTATVVPLELSISVEGSGGATGKSPTVAVRNVSSLTSYMDWNDNTFKTSGWTTKYSPMSEVERGHYQKTFNPSIVSSLTEDQFLSIEYRVDDGGSVKGDTSDILLLVGDSSGLTPTQSLQLLEMYELLGLNPSKPLVVSQTARKVPADGSTVNQTITDNSGTITVHRV